MRDSTCWNNPFAGFFVWNDKITELSGNVVAGSDDMGFVVYPVDGCNAATVAGRSRRGDPAHKISNNEAYGTLVGHFIMPSGTPECKSLHGLKAWKNAHIGIVTVDQSANLRIIAPEIADNHEGISLNFVQKGFKAFSTIEDAKILGSTAASTCDESTSCRAVSQQDTRGIKCNSEYGEHFRRVGIVMPQYTNLAKMCGGQISETAKCRPPNRVFRMCSLPWENRFGNVDVQFATLNITRTTFAYWKTKDCSKESRAIAINPGQPDFVPETYRKPHTMTSLPL